MSKSLVGIAGAITIVTLSLAGCASNTQTTSSQNPDPVNSTADASWCAGASQSFTNALQSFKDLDSGDTSASKRAISAFESFNSALPSDAPTEVPDAVSGLIANLKADQGPSATSQADSETVVSYFEEQCRTAFLAAGSNIS
jgi:hypothetical protein